MPIAFEDPKKGYILDDFELYDPKFSDVCTRCRHLDVKTAREKGWPKCRAFPKRIPEEIWYGKNNHTQPYPGDNGIQFSPIIL